MTSQWRFNKH